METNNYNAYVQEEGGELPDNFVVPGDKVDDYLSNNYILLPEGDYDFTIVDLKASRHIDRGNKVGNCKQINPVFRIIDPETKTPVDISNYNLYIWNSKGCISIITQYLASIWVIPKGKDVVMDWRRDKHIGQTGKLRIKHEKYTGQDGTERISMKIAKLYRKEATASGSNTANNWGWKQ